MRPWSSVCLPSACLLFLASTLFLAGCGGGSPTTASKTTPAVSPQISSIPVNGTQMFTATTNAPSDTIAWSIWTGKGPAGGVDIGTLTAQSSPTMVRYTAPTAPPLYSTYESLTPTGTVVLLTEVNGIPVSEQKMAITTPSVTVGFFGSKTITVALGSQREVEAYAVGSANAAISLQVNGITGGSTSTGTIVAHPSSYAGGGGYGMYIYTAPTAMPITGNTVTITAVSQADPTKSADLIVTLQ